jgi:2-isopropylmalate synthase
MKSIEIYDTTLRDGAQMRDISFSVNDKLQILEILDDLGFAYVEGGWPGANPKDVDFFTEAKKLKLKNTKLTAFGSTRKANTSISEDPILAALLRAETEVICIVAKSSAWQVETTMKASLDENLTMLDESIQYLKKQGRKVFLDAEHFFDGYADNADYSKKFIQAAIDAGADRMVLCDTNGGSLPEKVYSITEELVTEFGSKIGFGIHAHNDGELAVANSIRAIRAGAIQVQGTVNGYGERCGNANLISIIPNLQLKYSQDNLICIPEGNLAKLTNVAKVISEIANMNMNHSQAFVGERAFTHKGGLHASALAKEKTSYEHIDPALVGNKTRVVVSDQSGVSNIIDWFSNNDISFDDDKVMKEAASEVLFKIKELENEGYSFENASASFEILVKKAIQKKFVIKELVPKYFDLIETNVHVVNGEKTEATVRIRIGDKEKHSVSLGNGPTNALDKAFRKALLDIYPEVANFQLQDFKVRILDSHLGTAAITKVQITTGKILDSYFSNDQWNTIGVSANIVKASWDAVVESVVYGLMAQGVPSRNNPKEEVVC